MGNTSKFYESGVLNPAKHEKLVANISEIIADARIPEHLIYTPSANFCEEPEISWLQAFNHLEPEELGGLAFTGKCGDIGVKMFSMASVLLRNYIRARVFTLQEVIEAYKSGNPIEATVLFIPNFYLAPTSGGKIPEWQINIVLGMLYSRYANGNKTVLYVESLEGLGLYYGEPIKAHILNNFKCL